MHLKQTWGLIKPEKTVDGEGEKKLTMALGLKEGGVSTIALEEAELADSGCLIADHPEVVAKMREVAGQIEDGSLKLEDPMFAK